MKMIIAVTFLGILMHVFAEECTLMPATTDFNSEKYFSIPRVYAIYSKNGKAENVCREYETTTNPDGTIVTTVHGNHKIGEKSYNEFKCTNKEKSDSPGQFHVECKIPNGSSGTIKIQVETSVLSTDNEKYVVLQRCSKIGSVIIDDVVVLQTYKEGLERKVEDYFDTKGWTFSKWTSRKKAKCDDDKK
uniref:Pc22, similar to pallidipin n=1 Tax=Panstrongylus chinai TaxID=156444 RepID=A0A286T602_9HEMI|nr:Pc22, similar to pallidipin [Panstrongylus chinai]